MRDEDELRGRVKAVQAPPQPGQMGGVLDSLTLVLTSGGSTAVFCRSLFGWLGRLRDAKKVSLKVKRPDGQELELTCGSDGDAAKTLASLREFLEPGA